MRKQLQQLWDYDFAHAKAWPYLLVGGMIAVGGVGYVLLEVWFGMIPELSGTTITSVWGKLANPLNGPLTLEAVFPALWIAISVFTIAVRVVVIVRGYRLSQQALGKSAFARLFSTYMTSFFVGMLLEVLLVVGLSVLGIWAGLKLELGTNIIAHGVEWVRGFIDTRVPNLVSIKSYWVALAVTILVSGLPLYFVHWLSHKSRFFWYVFHRAHHCPQYLHPLAAPPAFAFGFLLVVPSSMVSIAVSKVLYTEPLVMEMVLWFTFGYSMEIFNHASANYQFALRNPLVRNLCRLYGDRGVYHLMHHSSKPGDEMINLSSGPLQVWDRLFGTYRAPYAETPEVGLTNNPVIKMNPFRIILSGVAQLTYELRMNKGWLTRWRVIFGDIYYQPPITKDFLILGYAAKTSEQAVETPAATPVAAAQYELATE